MKSICTDNPGIGNLLSNDLVYVDKTDILLKLISNPETRNLDKPEIERSFLV